MKFKSFKEYVDRKGKLVKPREEVKADYHDSIPKSPEGQKAPYVAKGIKVKGDQGLGDVGDKDMIWEPDTEVPSSKKKIVNVLDEAALSADQLDKQIYAKHPKGSKVDKATADQIIQMYKNSGLDTLDAPPTGPDAEGMYVIEQKSVGFGHSADPKFGDMIHAKIMSVMHSQEYKHKSSRDILYQVASELEEEIDNIKKLLKERFPRIVKMLKQHDIDQGHDYDDHEAQRRRQDAGLERAGVDESAFGKYVESKDAFKMMQDHPGKSCKKAHKGKTHEEWKKSKKSDKEESKDDDKKESKDDNGKSKFDMMKDHPFRSCKKAHPGKGHEEWMKSKKSDD